MPATHTLNNHQTPTHALHTTHSHVALALDFAPEFARNTPAHTRHRLSTSRQNFPIHQVWGLSTPRLPLKAHFTRSPTSFGQVREGIETDSAPGTRQMDRQTRRQTDRDRQDHRHTRSIYRCVGLVLFSPCACCVMVSLLCPVTFSCRCVLPFRIANF